MKRKDINVFKTDLTKLGTQPGLKFRYAYSKNMKLLDNEIEAIKDIIKPSEEFVLFQQKLNELQISNAKRDDAGEPIIIDNNYIMNDMNKFTSEYDLLISESKELVQEREKQIKEFEIFMEEDINIDFIKLNNSDIPENVTANEFISISFMINEEE